MAEHEKEENPLDTPDDLIGDSISSFEEDEESPLDIAPPQEEDESEENHKSQKEEEEEEEEEIEYIDYVEPSKMKIAVKISVVAILLAGGYAAYKNFNKQNGNQETQTQPGNIIIGSMVEKFPQNNQDTFPSENVRPPNNTQNTPNREPTGVQRTEPATPAANTRRTLVVPNMPGQNLSIEKAAEEILKNDPKDITWITNTALDPMILRALREAVQKNSRVFVVCGKTALQENLQAVTSSGIPLARSQNSMPPNMSVFFIDGKKVVDISNPELVWVTVEPTVIKTLVQWFWLNHGDNRPIK